MAFKFIETSSTGTFQTLFNRLIENPDTINLAADTPGVLSLKAIPMDGVDDGLTLTNAILLDGQSAGASATNLVFDAWIKPNVTGQTFNTFFDCSIIRNASATTSAYDGFYSGHVVTTAGDRYIDFRVDHFTTYSLSSFSTINLTAWTHVMCTYASGGPTAGTMAIWINGVKDREADIGSASVVTGSQLGARTISFGGILDEIRLWLVTGAATSISQLASVTAIGATPDSLGLNEFSPSGDTLAAWWRLDSTSAFQLFSAISGSIEDYTTFENDGTPSGFEGSDIISAETTIVKGLSASGDLLNLRSAELDHGGLTVLDPQNERLRMEMGGESLVKETYNAWTATGASVIINQEDNNIFYGNSGVKINTASADTGIFQNISNSALLYKDNAYTLSIRYRGITGSMSARVTFTLGESVCSVTAWTNPLEWTPVIVRNRLVGDTLTGRVDVIQLNKIANDGALFQVDGLQIVEGDYPIKFVGDDRMRKSSEISWPVID